MYKLAMLGVPFTVQNLNDRLRPLARRLRAVLCIVVRTQVRHCKSRTIRKHLEAQLAVLDHLARGDHVQRGLARAVLHAFKFGPGICWIQASRDGALAGADVDDAWRAGGSLEQRREGFEHQQRARSVGLEALRHLLRD